MAIFNPVERLDRLFSGLITCENLSPGSNTSTLVPVGAFLLSLYHLLSPMPVPLLLKVEVNGAIPRKEWRYTF